MNPDIYELNHTILTIVVFISSITIITIAAYVYVNSQRSQVFIWFELWMVCLFFWNIACMLRLYAPTITITYSLVGIEILAVIYLGPIILGFTRAYRGWDNKWSPSVIIGFLGPILATLYIIIMPFIDTDFMNSHMLAKDYGNLYVLAGFWVFFSLVGSVAFFLKGVRNPSVYWKNQRSNVGGAILIITVAALIQSIGLFKLSFDLPLMIMPIALILIGIAIMKYQFLDILPFAITEALGFIDDGFMVFGIDGNLEDYNKVFFDRLVSMNRCQDIVDVMLALEEVVGNKMSLNNLEYSLSVEKDKYISGQLIIDGLEAPMYLEYTTKGIYDSVGMKIASIVTFHDMTELQLLFQIVEVKKDELLAARSRLEAHIETIQQLTVENERNHLMLEVHDTLGHSMAEVLALLEQCEMILGEEQPDVARGINVINDVLLQSRDSLAEIRETVGKFREIGVKL